VNVRPNKTSLGLAVLCFVLAGTVAAQADASFDLVCSMSGTLNDGTPAAKFVRVYSVDFHRREVCTRTKGACGAPNPFSSAAGKLELYTFSPSLIVNFSAEFDPATNMLTEKTAIKTSGGIEPISTVTGRCKRQPFTPLKTKRT